eukprot:scaffold5850_cov110-Cylindrotheca_fusiformis.AAC.7
MMIRQRFELLLLLLLAVISQTVQGNDDRYYGNRYYQNNDDANNNGEEDQQDEAGDDAEAAAGDDYVAANYNDDWVESNRNVDDDMFHWSDQFSFFQSDSSYQCHFNEIGTFVVSIAHYMRAYFNYQALKYGQQFYLPNDAGYLNCVQLDETLNSDEPLYAKIGCQDRETYTSTKLALNVYTDAQCSEPYDDGKPSKYHSTKGYMVNGALVSTAVTFRPPFYKCEGCQPDEISETFNKYKVSWYDDDYISEHGEKQEYDQDQAGDDDGQNQQDDYFNDDFADDYYAANDDANRNRFLAEEKNPFRSELQPKQPEAAKGELEAYATEFWQGIERYQRQLYDNNYDIGDWSMCAQVFKYGVWCDEGCRSLDQFRTDVWSVADIILLSLMCTFLAGMMLLIVAKRLKAAEKSRRFSNRSPMPGLPPLAMLGLFICVMIIISVLAGLRFVNQTLTFAVVACVLVFIYMLKLTLFDNTRRPVLLAAANADWDTDNSFDERLYYGGNKF